MQKRNSAFLAVLMFATGAYAQLPPVPERTGEGKSGKPQIFVAQRLVDLGSIIEGDRVEVSWRIENQGSADLVIDRTKAGCGCTVVLLTEEQKRIKPGGFLMLNAEFDSTRRRGEQKKFVEVYTNDTAQPLVKLEFHAVIQQIVEFNPASILNFRAMQRGETAPRTLDILPAEGRTSVEVVGIDFDKTDLLSFELGPLPKADGVGKRVRFSVADAAALGTYMVKATVSMTIDGIARQRVVTIRLEVVGDLTWLPKLVNATRQPTRRGTQLAPVTIRAAKKRPFDILAASAGPLFEVSIRELKRGKSRTEYEIGLTLRDDAPDGPFGATLEIQTNSLDQPVVRVPVFGIVRPVLDIDPPVLVFRQDGSPVGTHRQVMLRAAVGSTLRLSDIDCPLAQIKAVENAGVSSRYQHMRAIDVSLVGTLSPGSHESVLSVTTNLEQVGRLEIPIRIIVPDGG